MEARKTTKTYSQEVKERAVRMVLEHQGEDASQWAAICSSGRPSGCRCPPRASSTTCAQVSTNRRSTRKPVPTTSPSRPRILATGRV
jgi:transposase